MCLSAGHNPIQNIIPAHSERPDRILGPLVAARRKRIIKESNKSVPPVKRILKGDLQLPDGPVHIPEAETMDPLENRLKLLPSCLEIPFVGHGAVPEGVDEQSLLMEEGGIELKQLECRTAPPVAVGLDCLAPCMDVIRVLG